MDGEKKKHFLNETETIIPSFGNLSKEERNAFNMGKRDSKPVLCEGTLW